MGEPLKTYEMKFTTVFALGDDVSLEQAEKIIRRRLSQHGFFAVFLTEFRVDEATERNPMTVEVNP